MLRIFSNLLLLVIVTCLSFRLETDWYNLLVDVGASEIMPRDLPRDTRFLWEIGKENSLCIPILISMGILLPSFVVVLWSAYQSGKGVFELAPIAFCLGYTVAIAWLAGLSLRMAGLPRYFASWAGEDYFLGRSAVSMVLIYLALEVLFAARKRMEKR